MADKVQKIKEEIERRIENLKISLDKNYVTEESKLDIRGNITTLYGLLDFIDSLPEEPANKDLNKEISKWRNHYISVLENNLRIDLRDIEITANHFAEWQRQQIMKDAVEGYVIYQIGSAEIAPIDIRYQVVSDRVYIPNVKLGDRVKIIIVKED